MHTFRTGKRSALLFISTVIVSAVFSMGVSAASSSVLSPVSDGFYVQWTPSSGASHFALVDESTCNGTTDYNSTTVVGRRDSYGVSLTTVPNGATITQIAIKPCASRVATGGANPVLNVFYRFAGVNSADSGSYSLTGTTPVELATTTYSSLSLVKTATSSLEIGAVLTSSTKGARLSRIGTVLTYTELTAPTTLVGTASTTSAVGLTWVDTSSNELGFTVERSTDATNWTGIATTSANVTSYYNSGLSGGTTYYHRVRGYNAGAYTAYTNVATTTTLTVPPSAPTSLTGSATTTSAIGLTWSDTSSNELNFTIERSLNGTSWTAIATTSANAVSYHDSGLSAGTTYYHRARAYNVGGYSGYSNTATTTTLSVPPNEPSNLSGLATSSAMIRLLWADNANNETGFAIEESSDAINWTAIASTSANTTTYFRSGLSALTTYYHRVRAFNAAGYSAYSNTATTTTTDVPPNAPTALFLTTAPGAGTTTDITVNWTDNSSNELSFSVERSIGGGAFGHVATTSVDAVSYTDFSRTTGTYAYRVRAFNTGGYSAYSNSASTTIP